MFFKSKEDELEYRNEKLESKMNRNWDLYVEMSERFAKLKEKNARLENRKACIYCDNYKTSSEGIYGCRIENSYDVVFDVKMNENIDFLREKNKDYKCPDFKWKELDEDKKK